MIIYTEELYFYGILKNIDTSEVLFSTYFIIIIN